VRAADGGQVSVFAEPDYCYGSGPLTLRVDAVGWDRPVLYDGEQWYQVEGVEIAHDGTERGRRQVLVRGRRLSSPSTPRRP
jgi:hypothetical protein